MKAVRMFQAATCAGSLALIAVAAPCSFGQATQQADPSTSAAVQQQTLTPEELQKQIDALQRQINLLKKGSSDSPDVRQGQTKKASVPDPVAVINETDMPALKDPHSVPFAFADFTWLNGNARTKDTPYATSFFTPEVRADVSYTYDFRHPADDTIVGSSEVFRAQEVALTDLAVAATFMSIM